MTSRPWNLTRSVHLTAVQNIRYTLRCQNPSKPSREMEARSFAHPATLTLNHRSSKPTRRSSLPSATSINQDLVKFPLSGSKISRSKELLGMHGPHGWTSSKHNAAADSSQWRKCFSNKIWRYAMCATTTSLYSTEAPKVLNVLRHATSKLTQSSNQVKRQFNWSST